MSCRLHPVNNYYANANICDISKSIETVTMKLQQHKLYVFFIFSASLKLIDQIILLLLSICPFTRKIYVNNYYAINKKIRSLFDLNLLKANKRPETHIQSGKLTSSEP